MSVSNARSLPSFRKTMLADIGCFIYNLPWQAGPYTCLRYYLHRCMPKRKLRSLKEGVAGLSVQCDSLPVLTSAHRSYFGKGDSCGCHLAHDNARFLGDKHRGDAWISIPQRLCHDDERLINVVIDDCCDSPSGLCMPDLRAKVGGSQVRQV